jgi:glucokinase
MRDRALLLGADLGGTKTLLALAELRGGRPVVLEQRRYENAEHSDFESVLRAFLDEAGLGDDGVNGVAVGVAGPVEGRRVKVTNLPWVLDADAIARVLGGPRVALLNDFAAAATGIDALGPDDLVTLQAGVPDPRGHQLVIGAGTGLGVAFRICTAAGHRIVPGEGGHAGFAPADARQDAFLQWLRARVGRVNLEHVVSGPGLASAYAFACERAGTAGAFSGEIDPAEVTQLALQGGDSCASEALDLMVSAYGAAAGDYALACLARGGVFIAGGVAPKILPRLRAGGFVDAFNAKGAMAHLARNFPVQVVTNEQLGLLGALAAAAAL